MARSLWCTLHSSCALRAVFPGTEELHLIIRVRVRILVYLRIPQLFLYCTGTRRRLVVSEGFACEERTGEGAGDEDMASTFHSHSGLSGVSGMEFENSYYFLKKKKSSVVFLLLSSPSR